MFQRVSAAAAAALCLAAAAPPADPAASFGARESIQSIRMSPDGRQIAYVAPAPGRASALYVVDLETGRSQVATRTDGVKQGLEGCSWVSNVRLLCAVYGLRQVQGDAFAASRLVALDRDGGNVVVLGDRQGYEGRFWGGSIIDWLSGDESSVLMVNAMRSAGRANPGLGVVKVDTRTDERDPVEKAVPSAIDFITDGHGQVRVMVLRQSRGATGMAAEEIDYRYRAAGSKEWQPLARFNTESGEGMEILAVDPALDAAYGLEKVDGRFALHRIELDGSGRKELVFAHDEVDVDGVIRIGRNRRVIGTTYATEARRAAFFDAEMKALRDALSKALPGLPLVNIVDSSADESRLLIWAGSDRDPGRYYTYDKASRRLNEIMLARPQLEGVELAEVRPVRYPAADGTLVPGYLTLPPGSDGKGLPAIVMPHGGPGARDEWGFDWLAQYYAHRGFAVLQPNFRGSTGYGDAWFQKNGFQSWRTAVGDVNDAGRWLVAQGIAAPDKLAIVGWSYGGYAALQSNVLDPSLYKAVVAIAPVTDLRLLKESGRWSSGFRLLRDFIGSGPHVTEGSPARMVEAIRAPVLLFHGDLDLNVDIAQSRLMEERLRAAGKPVELVLYPGLDHHLDDSEARGDMLRRSEAFLRRTLGL